MKIKIMIKEHGGRLPETRKATTLICAGRPKCWHRKLTNTKFTKHKT